MADNQAGVELTSDEKIWGALSYIFSPIVPIIILLLEDKKDNPYLRFHAINALMLGVVGVLLGFTVILSCISLLIWLYGLYLAYQAYNGFKTEVPVLTNLAKNQGWIK